MRGEADVEVPSTPEVFEDAMLSEGVRARRRWLESGECSYPVPERVTFDELRRAFLPSRTYRDVRDVGDKLLRTAELIIANSKLYQRGVPPSCSALGLDSKGVGDSCWFDDDLCLMVCDCPDGYAEFLPRDYAREFGVRCIPGSGPVVFQSDDPRSLASGVFEYVSARDRGDVSGMVLGIDRIVNAVHMSGPMADWLVEGGVRTLDRLREE